VVFTDIREVDAPVDVAVGDDDIEGLRNNGDDDGSGAVAAAVVDGDDDATIG
jgi:hypothetical protein